MTRLAAIPTSCPDDLEAMAQRLQESGDYRVLRRLKPWVPVEPPPGALVRSGLFVDVETMGLDPSRHEIIELAMVPFSYGLDGQIFEVGQPFQRLREPTHPIPPEITAITGIDDAMVAGHVIDPSEVTAFAAPAALVIAHNAAFDRRFLEHYCETFSTKAWACSMSQVDWAGEGHEGTKLAYLAAGAGFFYERHRATNDCLAAIELLGRPLPRSGRSALGALLEAARAPTWRIWAENSPFDLKDLLKARGYRWNADQRVWATRAGDDATLKAELAWLKEQVYNNRHAAVQVEKLDARARYSARAGVVSHQQL